MRLLTPFLLVLAACGGDVEDPKETNEEEVITTVILEFTPQLGGDALVFQWADPESDGSPVVDPIALPDVGTYALSIRFLNELESPPEEITDEVAAEAEAHQVFVTGEAVEGPATGSNPFALVQHAYSDADANGYDLGLTNAITTLGTGSAELVISLRHLPEEGGEPTKTADLATRVASDGMASIPGDTDVEVSFELEVVAP